MTARNDSQVDPGASSLGAADSARTSTSGLRARVRRQQRHDPDAVVFGSAQATAYFNARRLKQTTGAKRQRTTTTEEEDGDSKQAADPASTLVVRPLVETVTILRSIDDAERARRDERPGRAWPTFEHLFPEWRSQLRAGFSVLLHGVGTKLPLLQAFAETLPDDAYAVQLHGYLPSVSLKELVALLQDEVFRMPPDPTTATAGATRSLLQKCREIADYAFAHRRRRGGFAHVYLLIHSFDGPALREPEVQSALARLASAPFIHLLASIDSVNAPALWREADAQRFRWVYHTAHTLRPYIREIDLRFTREGRAAEQSISGVRYILQSLTPTDVGTLQLIAQRQLAGATSTSTASAAKTNTKSTTGRGRAPGPRGVAFDDVYAEARRRLLHGSMQSLKNSLQCLEDNGLVRRARVRNAERLVIPLSEDLLRDDILALRSSSSAASTTR